MLKHTYLLKHTYINMFIYMPLYMPNHACLDICLSILPIYIYNIFSKLCGGIPHVVFIYKGHSNLTHLSDITLIPHLSYLHIR